MGVGGIGGQFGTALPAQQGFIPGQKNLALRGAVQRQAGARRQRHPQGIGGFRHFQQQRLTAVQRRQEGRFTRPVGQVLQKGPAHRGDTPAAAGGAAQLKQMQPQSVPAVQRRLLHQTGLPQRGNDPVQRAFGQLGAAGQLPQRHRVFRRRQRLQNFYRFFDGLHPSSGLLHDCSRPFRLFFCRIMMISLYRGKPKETTPLFAIGKKLFGNAKRAK